MRKFIGLTLVALLTLAGCSSSVTGVDLADLEPSSIAGSWQGVARWSALQGGGSVGPNSTGTATATVFQSGAAILAGSTWEVTGLYSASMSGSIDNEGRFTGTTTVTVLAGPCTSTASFGGFVEGNKMEISTSFQNPGTAPCAGAPVGLDIELGR